MSEEVENRTAQMEKISLRMKLRPVWCLLEMCYSPGGALGFSGLKHGARSCTQTCQKRTRKRLC